MCYDLVYSREDVTSKLVVRLNADITDSQEWQWLELRWERDGVQIIENIDKVLKIVDYDHYARTSLIALELNIAQKPAWKHWKKAAYTRKEGVNQKKTSWQNLIAICESLLNRKKIDPFMKQMVTGDEK